MQTELPVPSMQVCYYYLNLSSRVEGCLRRKLDTWHVVPNCYWTPIPKFHIEMFLFKLVQDPRKWWLLFFYVFGACAREKVLEKKKKIFILRSLCMKLWKCKLCRARIQRHFAIFGGKKLIKIYLIGMQQCVHFQKSQKVVNHSTLLSTPFT